MGSGMLIDLEKYGLPYEMTVMDSLKSGADIVTFSGDKVLGGPQGGIIVGKKKYIEAMKKNQLTRTLRVDKMTIATLEATLRLYYDEAEALVHIPTLKMLAMTLDELEEKAMKLAELLSGLQKKAKNLTGLQENIVIEVIDTYSQVGGGAYPGEEIKSKGLALSSHKISANQLSEGLRKAPIPIIAKIRNERCELDVRTIEESEFGIIVDTLDDIFA
jgi:L-seryl-tRNA(Ser) seleniumtransferase